jgi:hypothetical protein
LHLHLRTQNDSEEELVEVLTHELGKSIEAILVMTPPLRKVLLRALVAQITDFAQAQSLNIVRMAQESEPQLDLGVWEPFFRELGKKGESL